MSKSRSKAFQKRFPGPYQCIAGTDGTENTYEVICTATNQRIAANFFWDLDLVSELLTYCVTYALNLLHFPDTHTPIDQSFLMLFAQVHPGPFAQERIDCRLASRVVYCTTTDRPVIQLSGSAAVAKHIAFALEQAWFLGKW